MSATLQTQTEARTMTGAEIVLQALKDNGVEVIFGYPGGAVLPIYDSIFKQNRLRHILVRHEQAAVHSAEGYARSTGKVGVVLVTSGPGATNVVTPLTDALMDSIPIVVLSAQVATTLIGSDAFQDRESHAILLLQKSREDVLRLDRLMIAPPRQRLCGLNRLLRLHGKLVDLHRDSFASPGQTGFLRADLT